MNHHSSYFYKPFKKLHEFSDWGIVAALGITHLSDPTFYPVIMKHEPNEDGTRTLAVLELHPAQARIVKKTHIRPDDEKAKKEFVETVRSEMIGTPTVFCPGIFADDPEAIIPFFIEVSLKHSDGPDAFDYIEKHPGDATARLDDENEWFNIWDYGAGRGLTRKRAERVIRMQMEPDTLSDELSAYSWAYNVWEHPGAYMEMPYWEMKELLAEFGLNI